MEQQAMQGMDANGPIDFGGARLTGVAEAKLSASVWPESRKNLNTSMKFAPFSALSMARMRKLMRFMRPMSMEPDISSANVARPSCVAVMRGEFVANDPRFGCARPLSAVSHGFCYGH